MNTAMCSHHRGSWLATCVLLAGGSGERWSDLHGPSSAWRPDSELYRAIKDLQTEKFTCGPSVTICHVCTLFTDGICFYVCLKRSCAVSVLNNSVLNWNTLRNKGVSWCYRRTFLSKWFHKEPLISLKNLSVSQKVICGEYICGYTYIYIYIYIARHNIYTFH